MKRNLTAILTVMLALVVTTAWADLDPRANFGTCGFTSVEETWEPDSSGTLMERVTYVSLCDTPSLGDETITITTEQWDGGSLVVTEVREAVRTQTAATYGVIYNTVTDVYDGSLALQEVIEQTYDFYASDEDIWFQDWLHSVPGGGGLEEVAYTTRTAENLGGDLIDVTHIYYDKVPRAMPVIPADVPVLGSAAAQVLPPPPGKHIDTGDTFIHLGRMYERVYNTFQVNPNTHAEARKLTVNAGLPDFLASTPGGFYVAAVIKGDRYDDPQLPDFNGFFTRWVKWTNNVAGELNVVLGWTSDRDLNDPTDDWWQARVKQGPSGVVLSIENAHRSGLTEEDHYDTYTVLNSFYMIESQTVKIFDWDELNPGNFTQTTTVTDGMAAPVSYTDWTVTYP